MAATLPEGTQRENSPTLREEPFKLKFWQKPRIRPILTGLVLSVFAIGLYYVLFETQVLLPTAGRVLMAVGGTIFLASALSTISVALRGKKDLAGLKVWRLVAPGMLVGAIIVGIGVWLFWASKQGYTYVSNGLVLNVQTTTDLWHHYQPIDFLRHGFRKEAEVVLIVGGAMSYSYNAYSSRRLRKIARGPRWYHYPLFWLRIPNDLDDEWRRKHKLPQLSGWQVLATFAFWQFVIAGVIVYAGLHVILHVHNYVIRDPGPGWLQTVLEPVTGPLAYLIIGLVAGRAARIPVGPVLNEIFNWRAQSWAARDKEIKWYHKLYMSPYQRERIRRHTVKGIEVAKAALRKRSTALVAALILSGFVGAAIWGVGLWVRIKYGAH